MKEDLAIAKNHSLTLQAENEVLRQEKNQLLDNYEKQLQVCSCDILEILMVYGHEGYIPSGNVCRIGLECVKCFKCLDIVTLGICCLFFFFFGEPSQTVLLLCKGFTKFFASLVFSRMFGMCFFYYSC